MWLTECQISDCGQCLMWLVTLTILLVDVFILPLLGVVFILLQKQTFEICEFYVSIRKPLPF